MSRVGGAVQRIEKRTEERVEKAVEQVAVEASAVMTANLDASNDRAERIIAPAAKLEARQLWSAAAAMCLTLLPVVVVVAGAWMAVAGLVTGAQWALDVDGNVQLGVGRWLVVAVGLAGAGYGLFASVRWVADLVETWKGRRMPKWRYALTYSGSKQRLLDRSMTTVLSLVRRGRPPSALAGRPGKNDSIDS